jgi:hypothetical protein
MIAIPLIAVQGLSVYTADVRKLIQLRRSCRGGREERPFTSTKMKREITSASPVRGEAKQKIGRLKYLRFSLRQPIHLIIGPRTFEIEVLRTVVVFCSLEAFVLFDLSLFHSF